MDIMLYRGPTGIELDLYDKRSEPGFRRIKMIRFPHIESNISDSAKYTIVTSQFVRFSRICTTKSAFVRHLSDLLSSLILKNYNKTRLFNKVRCLLFGRYKDIYSINSAAAFYEAIVMFVHRTLALNPPAFLYTVGLPLW